MSDTTRCVERVELLSLDMDAVEICGVASMGYGVTVAVKPKTTERRKRPSTERGKDRETPGLRTEQLTVTHLAIYEV